MDISKSIESEYEKFKNIPFPKDSSDNEVLVDVFFDLVEYDSYVAGTIDKLIVGKEIDPRDLIYEDGLEDRLETFLSQSPNSQDNVIAKEYLDYLLRIKRLLSVAAN